MDWRKKAPFCANQPHTFEQLSTRSQGLSHWALQIVPHKHLQQETPTVYPQKQQSKKQTGENSQASRWARHAGRFAGLPCFLFSLLAGTKNSTLAPQGPWEKGLWQHSLDRDLWAEIQPGSRSWGLSPAYESWGSSQASRLTSRQAGKRHYQPSRAHSSQGKTLGGIKPGNFRGAAWGEFQGPGRGAWRATLSLQVWGSPPLSSALSK